METERIRVEIQGKTPLLMNNIAGAALGNKSKKVMLTYDPVEDVKKTLYMAVNPKTKKEELYIPAYAVFAMILRAAGSYKLGKKSAVPFMAGTMKIEPEQLFLGTDNYEMDLRSVVIQKNRVLRARGKLLEWKASFDVVFPPEYYNAAFIERIIADGGVRVGLLDYRPEKRGWFGTFDVVRVEHKKS